MGSPLIARRAHFVFYGALALTGLRAQCDDGGKEERAPPIETSLPAATLARELCQASSIEMGLMRR